MTIEDIKNASLQDIETRLSAIKSELDSETADVDALEKETRALVARRKEIETIVEKRQALKDSIIAEGREVRTFNPVPTKEEKYDSSSPEYRTAWLKNIAVDNSGRHIFGDMNEVEKRAFTFTTENTGAVVPTEILNRIVSLVNSDSPIYDDSAKSSFSSGFSLPRLKAITAGDAKNVAEGAANDDEQDDFDSLDLPGVEIKKHIVLTRKMQFQSIQAFEDWLVSHLADRIRTAKEKYLINQLDATGGAGMDSANVFEGEALNDAEIRKVIGSLRGSGDRVLYANNNFIWNTLAGLENAKGEKLFITSSMSDPTVEGVVYGSKVKKDDNIPDDKFYIGYPKKLLSNNFIEFDVTPQIEAKTLNRIFVGYSLFDGGLEDPKAFAKWSKSGGAG